MKFRHSAEVEIPEWFRSKGRLFDLLLYFILKNLCLEGGTAVTLTGHACANKLLHVEVKIDELTHGKLISMLSGRLGCSQGRSMSCHSLKYVCYNSLSTSIYVRSENIIHSTYVSMKVFSMIRVTKLLSKNSRMCN